MEYTEVVRYGGPKVGGSSTHPNETVHAHFDIEGSQRLFLRELTSADAGVVYLGHRILENPADLRSHVQRILLLLDANQESDLQGALADLFIALGRRGGPLKQRLLDLAAPHISRTAAAYFRARLETGLQPWDSAVSRVRSSLLSLAYSGTHEVVRRLDRVPTGAAMDVLAEARDYLDCGQIAAARELLEQALRQHPDNREVAAELLEIYRCTRDDDRLTAMRRYLEETLQELPAGWAGGR